MLMDVTVYGPDDVATHIDVARYKADPAYRREIAEALPDLDGDYICATAEALELLLSSLLEPRH